MAEISDSVNMWYVTGWGRGDKESSQTDSQADTVKMLS